jgi:hypothetical protein
MICRSCATRADTEGKCTRSCGDPGCTCQHDHPWEQDSDNRPDIPAYVDGVDPSLDPAETVTVAALRCPCGTLVTGATVDIITASMEQHRFIAHNASRNPEITCQAVPPWDHERWCLRPKGHTGDHWTPGAGGGRWWHGDWS